jgi:hypothetical protein
MPLWVMWDYRGCVPAASSNEVNTPQYTIGAFANQESHEGFSEEDVVLVAVREIALLVHVPPAKDVTSPSVAHQWPALCSPLEPGGSATAPEGRPVSYLVPGEGYSRRSVHASRRQDI